jgi:hypothetical protein
VWETTTGEYRFYVGRSEGKSLLGRPRHKWEDNIKLVSKVWGGEAWTALIWLRIGAGGGRL